MNDVFFWIGVVVSWLGATAITAAAAFILWDWIFHRITTMQAIYRILQHARKNDLNLITGKPVSNGDQGR